MLQKLILISTIYVFSILSVSAQDNTNDINIGNAISIYSEILNEERKF